MRLPLAIITFLSSTAFVYAQNTTSKSLLAMTETARLELFTKMMAANNEKCDRTLRLQFNASVGSVDDWEMLCRDGNAYSMSIPTDPNQKINYLSCKELLALNNMMDVRAGRKAQGLGCKIK